MVLAAGLASALATGVVWPWVSTRGLAGVLTFDRSRVREGRRATATLILRNRMPWAAWGVVVKYLSHDGPSDGAACAEGWSVTESSWDVVPGARGEYPGEAPRIASAFPFGIWSASRPLSVPRPLLVWPAVFPVGPVPEAAGGRESEGVAVRNRAGTTGDLLGVRPYRRGDSLRRIHWPQSARQDALMVCELESRATPRVLIVIETNPGAHAGSGPRGSFEWSIRVAASFAEDWLGQGADVRLVFGRNRVDAGCGAVEVRRSRVLDALGRLRPDATTPLAESLSASASLDVGLRIVVATDRSFRWPVPKPGRADRYVLLQTAAFEAGGPGRGDPPSGCRPWIWIDDPGDVAGQVRRGWREVAVG